MMRRLLIASLVAAGLAGSALAHHDHNSNQRRRKSLGFGPEHPHAVFHSSPYQIQTSGFLPMGPNSDPFEVARNFVDDMLANQLSDSNTYKIRKDSYTDNATGVTHVYIRQVVNGVEVADGDINVNIKDGQILSYGNSFYRGVIPVPMANPDIDATSQPHQEYCDTLSAELQSRISVLAHTQVPMGSRIQADIATLNHLHNTNCQVENLPVDSPLRHSEDLDFRPALLQFMIAATPNSEVVNDILANFEQHMDNLHVVEVNSFAPDSDQIDMHVGNVPDTVNPVKARLAYIQVPNRETGEMALNLVWRFEVEMQDNWYEAAVTATAPHRIISVVDWANDAPFAPVPHKPAGPATYNVFKWGVNDPSEGERTLENEREWADPLASPAGWHAIPYSLDPSYEGVRNVPKDFWRNTTTTWGNNVFAQENWEGQSRYIDNYRPDAHDKVFDFVYNPQPTDKTDAHAESKKHINATVTQLFYTTNLIHDMYYRYGFDEVSGNFQQYNFGRGGAEDDGVIVNAQDGSGFNNANFMTPPDGQKGRMRMYLWNTAIPYRDGDLEAGIVIHEYSHGLSIRLTGGPANSACLGWGESGGMGEGWGDWLATTIRAAKGATDYAMGAWAANRDRGIRNYIYSLDETVNPSTYKTLDKPGYWGVHAIGEVWAEILWVVSQELIAKHGWSDTLFPPAPSEDGTIPTGDFYRSSSGKKPLIPKHGNSLAIQLVLNGMKLQPCRPSFFDARDAIIQADQVLTGGENFCELWKGFSKRGLGHDARVDNRTPWGGGIRTNGYKLPSQCADDLD